MEKMFHKKTAFIHFENDFPKHFKKHYFTLYLRKIVVIF